MTLYPAAAEQVRCVSRYAFRSARRGASGQGGSSVVEVAIALVILGVSALVIMKANVTDASVSRREDGQALQRRAARAVAVFAQMNGRLPCVGNSAGVEDCKSHASSGPLPNVTVGLPDPSARSLTYTLSDVALASTLAGSFQILTSNIAHNALNVQPKFFLNAPGSLNFCEALGRAGGGSDAASSPAFSLATGRLAALTGVLPSLVVSRSDLAEQMGCASRSALAGRAYPDVAIAAGALAMSVTDWRAQLEINRNIQDWDAGQSMWFAINSTMSTVKPVIKLRLGSAKYAADSAVDISQITTPATQIPIFATQAAALISNSARYVVNIIQGRRIFGEVTALEAQANTLYAQIQDRSENVASDYARWDEAAAKPPPRKPASAVYLPDGGPLADTSRDYVNALDNFYSIPGTTDFWRAEVNSPGTRIPNGSTAP